MCFCEKSNTPEKIREDWLCPQLLRQVLKSLDIPRAAFAETHPHRRWSGPAERSPRRHGAKFRRLSAQLKRGLGASGYEHRSPVRAKPDGVLFAQRSDASHHSRAEDYSLGDLVTWDLRGNVPHIGMVVDQKAASGRYMIVHNIGQGPRMEDLLFNWKITGHCRYYG
jgi:hypothetical protein